MRPNSTSGLVHFHYTKGNLQIIRVLTPFRGAGGPGWIKYWEDCQINQAGLGG